MSYVEAGKMPVQEVSCENALCFKIVGKWEDLNTLARQIKCQYIAPNATVVLLSGKHFAKENWTPDSELIVSGNFNLADIESGPFALVEQRIQEGLDVRLEWGQHYRPALVYSFDPDQKQPDEATDLGDLEGQPF